VLAAYAIVRLRYRGAQWVGGLIFMAYLVPPRSCSFPLATVVIPVWAVDRRWRDPDLSDILIVLDLALDGLFQDHPVRAGRMRADRRPPAAGRS